MAFPLAALAIGAAAGGGAGWLMGQNGKRDPWGTLNPTQVGLFKEAGGYASNLLNKNQAYTGQLTSPITSQEEENISRMARLGALSETNLNTLINPDLNEYNRRFDEYVQNPTMAAFQRNVLPSVLENTGAFTSEYGRTTADQLTNLTSQLGQQRFAGQEAAKDRSLQAIQTGANLVQTSAGIFSIPREIKQAGLDREVANFYAGNEAQRAGLNSIFGLLNISTVTRTPDTRGQMALSGALGGASIGMGIANNQSLLELLKSQQGTTTGTPTVSPTANEYAAGMSLINR